jgi:hypothetical protein
MSARVDRVPRVLILSRTRITERDNSGASLGKWFAEWPAESLAQIYSWGHDDAQSPCGYEYKLGRVDRRGGRLFTGLKASVLGSASRLPTTQSASAQSKPGLARRLTRAVSGMLVESGAWELLFQTKLSAELGAWIESFRPSLLFVVPSDLSFINLALMVARRFGLPVVVFASDDFPLRLYRRSPFLPLLRPRLQRAFHELAHSAAHRFASGPLMQEEYRARYGLDFEPLMMCDDSERFRQSEVRRPCSGDSLCIVFAGNLGHGRWRSIIDVHQAGLNAPSGRTVQLVVYTPVLDPDVARAFASCPQLTVRPSLTDREVPSYFRGADILLLAEGFDRRSRRDIRLSLSSKCHLYMMSQRPILVYGPPDSGTVHYARKRGWAHVVDEPSSQALVAALEALATDSAMIDMILEQGRHTSSEFHEGRNVRRHLRTILEGVAATAPPQPATAPGRARRA